jgi:hypothetical protein
MLGFLLGVAFTLGLVLLWKAVRLLFDLRATRAATDQMLGHHYFDPRLSEAHKKVEAYKVSLRWQKDPNPQWAAPLIEELPNLVKEIAQIYYPKASDPLRAPGLSQFTRAIHLTAMDISDFLQNRRVGRLLDVSANTAWKAWEIGEKISDNEQVKKLKSAFKLFYPLYRKVRPAWQVVRYKSPLMWFNLLASNLAIRTLQPAVVDIVARRAIELYSGQLAFSADRHIDA